MEQRIINTTNIDDDDDENDYEHDPNESPQFELTGWLQSWTTTMSRPRSKEAEPATASDDSPRNYGTVSPQGSFQQDDDDDDDDDDGDDAGESLFPPSKLDIEEAMERLGMGAFQVKILVAAGLCFAADAMEVLLLSFLSVILTVEWGLEGHENDLLISVVFLGALVGTLVLSPLGDTIGRRPVFSLTAAIIAVFGVGTAFCTNYEALLFVRFMVGFGVGGLVVPFDTLAEFLPSDYRGPNLLYIEFFWTFGTLLVPVFAWFSLGDAYGGGGGENDDDSNNEESSGGSWQLFCILCAVPCIISTILGIILVPESPRWLLTKGRHEEALAILRQAAEGNGLNSMMVFPPGTYLLSNETEDGSLLDLVSKKWLRTTLLLWVAWFGLAFLYYGAILAVSIVFTDVEQDGDGEESGYAFDYQAIFISASSEFVGLFLVLSTIDRWGRIPTQTLTYVLGGVSCLLMGYASHYGASRSVLVTVAFVARMAMMGATCTTWVSTSEILTTDIRATGHGWANAMARIGGSLCPYIISERNSMKSIGQFLFVVSCVAATVVWQLPETSGHKLGSDQMTSTHGSSKEGKEYKRFEQ